MFRYKDEVLSLNNFVDRIYPFEPEIKDTRDTDRSISYLDLHREIDSEGRLGMKLNDKRDDFNIPIVKFPFICSNIPEDTKGAISIRISKNRQHNGKKKRYKRKNNDRQNMHMKLKFE
jgi:hypothetical protein